MNLLRPFSWRPTGKRTEDAKEYDRRLRDDAWCRWNGYLLRYEQMSARCWWWAVYRGRDELESSNDDGIVGRNHEEARALAEASALRCAAWARKGRK